MGKLIVELPDDMHGELKKKAAVNRTTLKDIVSGLISDYLQRKEKVSSTEDTGLCGLWDDERSAEAIVKDIKEHRKWFRRRKD